MKRILLVVAAFMFIGLVGPVMAQKKNSAAKEAATTQQLADKAEVNDDISLVSGTVNVTKDAKTGEVTELGLMTQSGFKFMITRDDGSKYLEQQNGQTVELTSVISVKDGKKWITIKKPVAMLPVDDIDKDDKGKKGKKNKKNKDEQKPEKKPPKKVNFGY